MQLLQSKNVKLTENAVRAETIKDAGDDPDATHQALIVSTVSWIDTPGIILDGGVGVGRVTKPGSQFQSVKRRLIRFRAK